MSNGAAPLLADPVLSVRLAAFALLSPSRNQLQGSQMQSLRAAQQEYIDAQLAIAERPEAMANLARVFVETGDVERAEEYYRQALRLQPRYVAARSNLADLYRSLGREADSEALLREGIELEPIAAPLHHALGLLLVRIGRPQDALTSLGEAARLDTNNYRFAYVYGIALHSLERSEDAIAVMQNTLARFPGAFDVRIGLTTMLRGCGSFG